MHGCPRRWPDCLAGRLAAVLLVCGLWAHPLPAAAQTAAGDASVFLPTVSAGFFVHEPVDDGGVSDGDPAGTAGAAYYVDCTEGDDAATGLAQDHAWQSIARANRALLSPGDRLLLKRDCSWPGPLRATWRGTAAAPIVIGAYGAGSRPLIREGTHHVSNILITGAYLVVEYLETTLIAPPSPDPGCRNQPVGWRAGFTFGPNAAYNTVRFSKASRFAAGISFHYTSHHNRALNNTLVGNHVVWTLTPQDTIGAMGILLHGSDNEVAYNYFANNRALCTYTGAAESNSIELFGASRAHIHHNISLGDRVFSEMGSSAAAIAGDNTYAYNLHVAGETDSVTGPRFLVMRGSGHPFGPVWRTKVYHNTVYQTGRDGKAIACAFCSGDVLEAKYNILVAALEPISTDGLFVEAHNLLWSPDGHPLINFPLSPTSLVADPQFTNPGGRDFRLLATSPALNRGGRDVERLGYTHDLQTVPLPLGSAADLGAYESH